MKTLFELTAEYVGEYGDLYPDSSFSCQPRPVLERLITKLSASDLYRLEPILDSNGLVTNVVWRQHCQALRLLQRSIRDEFGETDTPTCYKAQYHLKQFHALLTILSISDWAQLCDSPTPTEVYRVPLHRLKTHQRDRPMEEGHPVLYKNFLFKCAQYCKKLVLNGKHVYYIASCESLMHELVRHVENVVISPLTSFCFHHFKHLLKLLLTEGHLKQLTFRGSTLSDAELVQLLTICSGCPCLAGEDVLSNHESELEMRKHWKKMLMPPQIETGSSIPSCPSDPKPSTSKAEEENFKEFCDFYLQDEEMDWTDKSQSSESQQGPTSSSDVVDFDVPLPSPKDFSIPSTSKETDAQSYSLSPDAAYCRNFNESSVDLVSRFVSSRSVSECLSAAGHDSETLSGRPQAPCRAHSYERLCPGSGGIQSFAMTSDTGTLRAGDIIGQFLPHWSNLRRLSVFLSSGIRKNVKDLVKKRQLSHLVIDTCLHDDILEDLIHLFASHYPMGTSPMDVLQISSCHLICSGGIPVFPSKLSALRMLDLSWNALQDGMFALLLEFLKADTALKALRLASCQLQPRKICKLLAVLCERDTDTEELCLSDNRIEDEGCEEALTQFVCHSPALIKLSLSNVGLAATIENCAGFVSALGSHPSLQVLDISNNYLGLPHLQLIEEILCHSPVLKTLNFAFNHFKGEDLIAMSIRAGQVSMSRHHKMATMCLSRNLFNLEEQKQILHLFSAFATEVKANCINLQSAPLEHVAQM